MQSCGRYDDVARPLSATQGAISAKLMQWHRLVSSIVDKNARGAQSYFLLIGAIRN